MLVRGIVQGVGFRYFVLRAAKGANLTGTVKNLRDGSVEVVAEGDRQALERFVADVARGPGHAVVREVEQDWGEPTGEFTSFDVALRY
jgi:acylphosphatase